MLRRCSLGIWLLVPSLAAADPRPIDFNRDIRPILSENCFRCHGADAAQRQADLRLDDRDSALATGAIVPGDPAASTLVERITADDAELQMPPPDSKLQLTPEQVELLTRWVSTGAEYQPHWAFQPVNRPAVPSVALKDWPRNEIDRFVLARLEQEGLAPSRRAPLPTLLRRISLDLIGLPPTPAQLTAWQTATDPVDAAVTELLASPHYGERLAADWLDVARYADTHGFNNDSARTMWRWRDWVVDAFNANMPYDRFITVQLAGDLLPEASLDDRIATAFNRNHVINSEGGIIDEEYRVEYVADRVRTMSMAWLGLTMECARCHDHKFDPVSQREYYRLFAFFNSVDETGEDGRVDNATPLMRAPTAEQWSQHESMQQREAQLRAKLLSMVAATGAPAPRPALAAPAAEPAFEAAADGLRLPAETPVSASAKGINLSDGWTFSAWIQPESDAAAPVVSTMDFDAPQSSQGYGQGMQVGLASGGAIEVRIALRWPGYALCVRSVERLGEARWRHVAVVGSGRKASGIRLFIDGVEAETETTHDDLSGGVSVEGAVRIGHSNESADSRFTGGLTRVRAFPGAMSGEQLDALLRDELLNHAPDAGDGETSWQRALVEAEAAETGPETEWAALLAEWKHARTERLALQRTFPTLMIMRELPEPRPTFVLERGQYDKPGERVEPGVPALFNLPLPAHGPRDRVALARWLTDRRHPLTARVVVNRYWQSLFGVGLVKTVEDFGSQSEWPSHPELLDWLAADFMDSGWDVKRLLRLIIESAAYQQDSAAAAERWASDPENRLLSRGPRQRLTAEMIRDQALAVGGLLVPRLGGPPVYPYQPADLYQGIVVAADYPGTTYTQSQGEDLYRRSLYTFWKRTVPHPTLSTFDAPDREFCSARRSATNTPLQALVLMNDPAFLEAARGLAARMLAEGGDGDEARLAWGFELLTARPPAAAELAQLVDLLNEQRAEFAAMAQPPRGLLEAGQPVDSTSPANELAPYASVASLLLNLDEAIVRN